MFNMTQKIKDLLHAISITIAFIICFLGLVPGTIYIATMNSVSILTIIWGLIWALGTAIFGYGAYICWKEYKIHHKTE